MLQPYRVSNVRYIDRASCVHDMQLGEGLLGRSSCMLSGSVSHVGLTIAMHIFYSPGDRELSMTTSTATMALFQLHVTTCTCSSQPSGLVVLPKRVRVRRDGQTQAIVWKSTDRSVRLQMSGFGMLCTMTRNDPIVSDEKLCKI